MASRLLTAVLAATLSAGVVAAQTATTAWPDFLAFYRQALTQHGIVGSSVALIEQGRIVQRAHEGLRDQKTRAAVDDNTIFHWASITKTFTGIAIMRLRDEGKLALSDPIVKYVPEFRKVHNPFGPVEQITIRHLLSHSSGLRSGTWPWGGQEWNPFDPPGWEQLVGMMPYTRIEFAPGSQYQYSNPGIVFSRESLLERVWSRETHVTERSVYTLIKRLRQKVETESEEPTRILTVWGTGYKFTDG